jgi:NAD(P)-dependent dehydrogenase (short-subunit alcohol dehydrogenase family)
MKETIRMITRGAVFELAEQDIRVNAVALGQIVTESVDGPTQVGGFGDDLLKPVPLSGSMRIKINLEQLQARSSDSGLHIRTSVTVYLLRIQ